MNSLLSAIKAFVLKSRPAYKDDLGNGKYDIKKLPEECVPDSVTLPKDGNPGDILVKTATGSAWQKQEPVETLPTDGNPGDVLVRTETGSAWKKQEQGGGRLVVNGQPVEYGGRARMMLDKTVSQIYEAYNSGKTVMLNVGSAEEGMPTTLMFNGNSFYRITPSSLGSSGISAIGILLVGNPALPEAGWTQSDVLWDFAQFNIRREG